MTMITSRGCPGNCIYCAVKTVWGRCWRGRSPTNVVDEIETLVKDYAVEEIHFLDDSISVDRQRLAGICREIIRRKINVRWTTPNGIAVWLLDRPLLRLMKKASCYRLTFGLESGDPEILRSFVGKFYDHEKAKEVINYASKIGLWTLGTFIIGFPYETREQIEKTINFAIATDLDFATFYIANPFPGTRMYDIYKKENLLPPGGAYEVVRGCDSKLYPHSFLVDLQSLAFKRFLGSRLRKPQLVWRKLKSGENWPYLWRLGNSYLNLLRPGVDLKAKGIAALWKREN